MSSQTPPTYYDASFLDNTHAYHQRALRAVTADLYGNEHAEWVTSLMARTVLVPEAAFENNAVARRFYTEQLLWYLDDANRPHPTFEHVEKGRCYLCWHECDVDTSGQVAVSHEAHNVAYVRANVLCRMLLLAPFPANTWSSDDVLELHQCVLTLAGCAGCAHQSHPLLAWAPPPLPTNQPEHEAYLTHLRALAEQAHTFDKCAAMATEHYQLMQQMSSYTVPFALAVSKAMMRDWIGAHTNIMPDDFDARAKAFWFDAPMYTVDELLTQHAYGLFAPHTAPTHSAESAPPPSPTKKRCRDTAANVNVPPPLRRSKRIAMRQLAMDDVVRGC